MPTVSVAGRDMVARVRDSVTGNNPVRFTSLRTALISVGKIMS